MKRVRYIPQIQQTECGISVIAMMLDYYGAHYSLYDIREFSEIGRDGMSAAGIIVILKKFGMEAQAYHCDDIKLLAQLTAPFIIIEEEQHFIIVEKITKKTVYITDPGIGHIRYSYDEFLEKFDGICIEAKPGKEFKKKRKEYKMLKILFPFITGNKKQYLVFTIFSFLNYLVMVALPVSIQKLVDGVFNNVSLSKLALAIFIISVFYIIFNLFIKFSATKLKIDVDKKINKKVISHMMQLSYLYFDTRKKSSIIYTLNHISSARDVFVTNLLNTILNAGMLVVIWIYFLMSDTTIALVLNIALLPNIILSLISQKILISNMKKLVMENSNVQGYQTEIIYAMFAVKAGAREDNILYEWNEKYDKYIKKYETNEKITAILGTLLNMSQTLSPVLVLVIGIFMSKTGILSIGKIVALFSLSEIFFSQVYGFLDSLLNIGLNYVYIERLGDILLAKKQYMPGADAKPIESINTIECKNLSFRYTDNTNYILNDITFKACKGEMVAITGRSGSGKSTLLKIISGLYEISDGMLLINGIRYNEIERKSIVNKIGIVPQESYLFNKTIYENIVQEQENVTKEELEKVLTMVNIYDEITNMPMGLNTVVSEMGMNLSGGQRQRIVIARELIKHPSVLIMDEATGALDFVNEKQILERISKLNITIILVTHRLASIQNADKILFIDNGRIAEQGKHSELMDKQGKYYNMYSGK